MTTPKFRVAIVGGGIGGVCLALGLSQYPDIAYDIYEKHGNFEEIGAGVGIWGRSIKALDQFGVAEELAKVATPPPPGVSGFRWEFRRSDIKEGGKPFKQHLIANRGSSYHRAHFLSKLLTQMPDGHAHFKKRLTHYTRTSPTSEITLYFADGSTATCDVLVGADGVKSPVRTTMAKEKAETSSSEEDKAAILAKSEPVFSGTVAYRAVFTSEQLKEANGGVDHPVSNYRVMYCGKNANLAVFPVAGGRLVNVAAFVAEPDQFHKPWGSEPWVCDVSHEEITKRFEDWEPDVRALIRCMPKSSRWAIHEIWDLPFYVLDRIAVLGDAAHATTPHFGQGANQSIEDAYILARILGNKLTTLDTVALALKAYEKVRLPRGNETVFLSSEAGKNYQMAGQFGEDLDAICVEMDRTHQWFKDGDVDEDVGTALQWLESEIKA